jgi:hypothetical protein
VQKGPKAPPPASGPKAPASKPKAARPPSQEPLTPIAGPATPYHPSFVDRVRSAADVGYTVTEVARLLNAHTDDINLWTMVYPEFAAAMRANGQARNDRVENAYYQRCVGYEHESEQIVHAGDGEIVRVPIMRHVPADSAAALKWLENHKPEEYRNRVAMEHTGRDGGPIEMVEVTDEMRAKALAAFMAKTGGAVED